MIESDNVKKDWKKGSTDFKNMIDEVIEKLHEENCEVGLENIKEIDKEARKKGIPFYDYLFDVLKRHQKNKPSICLGCSLPFDDCECTSEQRGW